jgi:hypothetical protein
MSNHSCVPPNAIPGKVLKSTGSKRDESGARTISCPRGFDARPTEDKRSGILAQAYAAVDENLTALHPQLQIVLSDMRMVLLVRDESTFSFSPGDGGTDRFPIRSRRVKLP